MILIQALEQLRREQGEKLIQRLAQLQEQRRRPEPLRRQAPQALPQASVDHQTRNGVIAMHVVVVYHVTIVAIGHGLMKKFWPMVIGCVLRTAGSSII